MDRNEGLVGSVSSTCTTGLPKCSREFRTHFGKGQWIEVGVFTCRVSPQLNHTMNESNRSYFANSPQYTFNVLNLHCEDNCIDTSGG